jgi:hypothetical protein
MAEIDDNTRVAIPLRNLVALGAGLVMATTAYVTLDTRLLSLEHAQDIQDLVISENSAFVREWPLGLRGALPDDLIQNAKIMALEERNGEIDELRKQLNRMEVEIGRLNAQLELAEKNCSCSVAM